MAITLQDKTYQSQWKLRTEYIIAMLGIGFALFLFSLNIFFGLKSPIELASEQAANPLGQQLTVYAYWIYPVICVGRLAWLHMRSAGPIYIWISALIDTLFLTIIIYAFSLKYQNASASLLAPTFNFYYVIIALHAMRFNAKLVLVMGFSTILIWLTMLFSFLTQDIVITQSYAQYISSSNILIGSEVEKLIALGIFSLLIAIGVKRAKDLLSEAAEKRISDVKMIESERASRVKTQFLATMSHELRTPLNGVIGMSEVLKTTELSETQEELVDIIENSGQELLSIIEDILDYTQLESDETKYSVAPFELKDVIAKVDRKIRSKAKKKQLDFRIITEGAENIVLIGDESRLTRILINLVGNAVKFTKDGYVILHITAEIMDAQSSILKVYVQDSGIGIAEENHEIIFEKFSQADNSMTREYGGAGLGLSISQTLVRAEGGEIKLDSQLGRGSRFSFEISLPYKPINEAVQKEVPLKPITLDRLPIIESPSFQEDDPLDSLQAFLDTEESTEPTPIRQALILSGSGICQKLQQDITDLGLKAKCEDDVKTALTEVAKAVKSKQPYDVLIIDCDMPNINSARLIEIIQSKPQFEALDIIALYSPKSSAITAKLDALRVSLLTKPYSEITLRAALNNTPLQVGSAA